MPLTTSVFSARLVRMMTYVYTGRVVWRIRRTSSTPETRGISQSVMTMSTSAVASNCSQACWPSSVTITSWPHDWS
jgi:hypothetical protein